MGNNSADEENLFRDRRFKALTDCDLLTEDGKRFPVHRGILAKKSPYFYAMFCDCRERSKEILLRGIEGNILKDILKYIYTNEVRMNENFCELMVISDYLLLDDLLGQMKENLAQKLALKNCLSIFNAAARINQVDICKTSFRFVVTNFENVVRDSQNLSELSLEDLKRILKDRNLRVSNERIVWLAIIGWVEADLPGRLPSVPDLLMCLAMGDVDENLAGEILSYDFFDYNEFSIRVSDIKKAHTNQLDILQNFLPNSENNDTRRSPPALHFISYRTGNLFDHKPDQIYLTYDEKIDDLWCKLLEVDSECQIFPMDSSIYIFRSRDLRRYNVVEKEWFHCKDMVDKHSVAVCSMIRGIIYKFWYDHELFPPYNIIFRGEFYHPELDEWYETESAIPMYFDKAVVLSQSIYVAGCHSESNLMVAQVYNAHTQTWTLLPSPPTLRLNFSLIAYHGKIFLIGGFEIRPPGNYFSLKSADVFDPEVNDWYTTEMPYAYSYKRFDASVIKDHLIVSGDHSDDCQSGHLYSAVMWEEDEERWKVIDGPSPDSKVYRMVKYYEFHTLDDTESVNIISKANKDPETIFEKSPFSDFPL